MLIHATAVALRGACALLTGPSGSGKSDLALRLLDRGWTLVADDYVRLAPGAVAHAPPPTRGLIEARGLGIIAVPWTDRVPATLLVELTPAPPRHPDPRWADLAGTRLPTIAVDPRPASAPILVELAFARARRYR